MKYALTTKCGKKYLEEADEIIVTYKEKEKLLEKFLDFIEIF